MLFYEALAKALSTTASQPSSGSWVTRTCTRWTPSKRQPGCAFVSMSNESGGVLAANGYARTSGRLGRRDRDPGPALTNTVTALVESVRDHTPLLLIAGDTGVEDSENFQNISQRDVVMPTGAGFEQVRAPGTLAEDLATAVRRAVWNAAQWC